jgi:DNA-binding response OmpR family regulator
LGAKKTAILVVLLDLMMPKRNGFEAEACERMRRFSAAPIMVLTALDRVEEKACAFDLGADDYLTKPFNPIELLARVPVVSMCPGRAAPFTDEQVCAGLFAEIQTDPWASADRPLSPLVIGL